MKYVRPELDLSSFTCPYCDVLAEQKWESNFIRNYNDRNFDFVYEEDDDTVARIAISSCHACGKYHLWYNDKMMLPQILTTPLPTEDMPKDVKENYLEARSIVNMSPKASAALLRLALQHLCIHLGGEGKNINNDIAMLVRKGLDVRVQKALDTVRVTGNYAVHPGEINFEDNPHVSTRLFSLLNYIVDAMITQPKLIDSFFDELPESAKTGIQKRDK